MENNTQELYHYGIKGQKWGQRLFQNKDGSLTPLGRKRYQNADGSLNAAGKMKYKKEADALKKETAKVKAAEQAAVNRKKSQSKFTKLEEKKAALEARKKALKEGKDPEEEAKKDKETPEEKKARLMNSSDAKELYKNRELLSTQELNDRINRIETEARLSSKIVEEKRRTGKEFIEDATAMYKTIDNAYSTIATSAIGKTIAKKLGLEPPKEKFNLMEKWAKIDEMDDKAVKSLSERVGATKKLAEAVEAEKKRIEKEEADAKAEKEAKKAEKEAAKEAKKEAKETKKAEKEAAKEAEKSAREEADKSEIIGEGTSKSSIKERSESGDKWWEQNKTIVSTMKTTNVGDWDSIKSGNDELLRLMYGMYD